MGGLTTNLGKLYTNLRERIDGEGNRHSQVRWWFVVRGHDKPRLLGVAIAIDPFRVPLKRARTDVLRGYELLSSNFLSIYWGIGAIHPDLMFFIPFSVEVQHTKHTQWVGEIW